ncbi:phage tail assembly chaperone [Pelagibacterium lentulum]
MPKLLPGGELYFEAFWKLNGDRQIGVSVGPIPFVAIDRYADRMGFNSPREFSLLHRLVTAMDGVYLDHLHEKAKEDGGQPQTSGRNLTPDLFDAVF